MIRFISTWKAVSLSLTLLAVWSCVAASEKEPLSDGPAILLEDDAKDDSLSRPTARGDLGDTFSLGTLTAQSGFHSYAVQPRQDRTLSLLAISATRSDLVLVVQRRDGRRWRTEQVNDDCDPAYRDPCLNNIVFRGGQTYRVIVTTYDAYQFGVLRTAEYTVAISCTGGCEPVCGPGLAKCTGNTYCDFLDDQCGAATVGHCVPKPAFCPWTQGEVCACTGESYSSTCEAALAGHDVGALTRCENGQGEGETCGGIAALTCGEGLECDYSGNLACYADAAGICVQPGFIACLLNEYDPVCGCDGVTYRSGCYRRMARVAQAHRGSCQP